MDIQVHRRFSLPDWNPRDTWFVESRLVSTMIITINFFHFDCEHFDARTSRFHTETQEITSIWRLNLSFISEQRGRRVIDPLPEARPTAIHAIDASVLSTISRFCLSAIVKGSRSLFLWIRVKRTILTRSDKLRDFIDYRETFVSHASSGNGRC